MPLNTATRLTAPGTSAIAVIRLFGPGVPGFLSRRFDRPVRVGRVTHGNLTNDSGILDDPVIARLDLQTIDINVHGGVAVIAGLMELAASEGFVINPPAAIPTDLPAEMLAAVPLARTESALRAILAQTQAWKNLASADAEKVLADSSGRWLIRTPLVAIVGPANVGKSTLANRLFGTDRAIVADLPGTTRDWVGGVADLHGLAVTLIDTPGRRITDDPVEIAAVAAAGDQIRAADLVVVVIDTSVEPTPDARHVLAEHPAAIVVANKFDLPAIWAVPGAVPVSAVNGQGIDDLMACIRRRFGWDPPDIDRARWWTARQREQLCQMSTFQRPV